MSEYVPRVTPSREFPQSLSKWWGFDPFGCHKRLFSPESARVRLNHAPRALTDLGVGSAWGCHKRACRRKAARMAHGYARCCERLLCALLSGVKHELGCSCGLPWYHTAWCPTGALLVGPRSPSSAWQSPHHSEPKPGHVKPASRLRCYPSHPICATFSNAQADLVSGEEFA